MMTSRQAAAAEEAAASLKAEQENKEKARARHSSVVSELRAELRRSLQRTTGSWCPCFSCKKKP